MKKSLKILLLVLGAVVVLNIAAFLMIRFVLKPAVPVFLPTPGTRIPMRGPTGTPFVRPPSGPPPG